MSTITYENIHVNGIAFEKILYLRISHAPNAHGRAEIRGLIPCEQTRRLAEQIDETTGIEITTDAKEQPQCLFYGVVNSDMDINITCATKVNIQGGEEVKIIAENEVLVGTATSYLDSRKEGITASAENIILN